MNTWRQWAGSLVFTSYLFVSWIPFALGVLIVGPFSHRAGLAIARAWVRTVMTLCWWLCGIRYEVEGLERLPQDSSVVLLKHSSTFETLAELEIFPPHCWVLKRELMWIPIFGWALAVLKPIAIDRRAGRSAVEQVVVQGSRRLQQGLWVMIFPEGTRTAVGQTRRYGLSGVLLAQRNGLPVVPVAHNAGMFWPRRGWLKKPGVVRIVIGAPITTRGRDAREVTAEVQDWIESRVAELTGLPKVAPPPRR